MCSAAIAKAYPDATADVQQQATDTCVKKLTGKTPDDAQAAMPDLVAGLVQTYPGLVPPAPSPTPTSDPSATTAPTGGSTPNADPSTTPGTDPNATPAS